MKFNMYVLPLLAAFFVAISASTMEHLDDDAIGPSVFQKFTPEIFDALHSKKYLFSKPKLLTNTVCTAILAGKVRNISINPADLIELLEYHAQSDEEALQKLYTFRKLAFGKINFVDQEKAGRLLNLGTERYYVWALEEKIKVLEKGKGATDESIQFHIKLAHLEILFKDHQEKIKVINNSIEVIDKFFGNCDETKSAKLGYGRPLRLQAVKLERSVKSKKNTKNINNFYVKAAALGDFKALIYIFENKLKGYNNHDVLAMFEKTSISGFLNNIAIIYDEKGQREKALNLFIQAAELGHIYSMGSAGDLLSDKGREEEALKYYQEGANLGDERCARCAGFLLQKNGKIDEALADYKIADVESPTVAYNTALIYYHKSEFDKALPYFELAGSKGFAQALYPAGMIYLRKGEKEKALARFLSDKGSSESVYNAGWIYFDLKKYEEAFEFTKKSIELDAWCFPKNRFQAEHNRATLEGLAFKNHKPNIKKSITLLQKSAKAGVVESMVLLSYNFVILGNYKSALFWYQKAYANGATDIKHLDYLDNVFKKYETLSDSQLVEVINEVTAITGFTQTSMLDALPAHAEEVIPSATNIFVTVDDEAEKTVDETSSDDEDEYEDYPSFEEFEQKKKEAQHLRTQLDKIAVLQEQIDSKKISVTALTKANQSLWSKIKDGNQTIELVELKAFSGDPIFIDRLFYKDTKKGITFHAKFGESGTVGTHRKHNKSYKGVNATFKKEFYELICIIFGMGSAEGL